MTNGTNIFLTSAGFDNPKIRDLFLQTISREGYNTKVLFIPTAAINEGGRQMLPFCRQELLEAGILESNIEEVEVSELASIANPSSYSAIYVAGGDTVHLVQEMRRYGFRDTLDRYLAGGGVYLGVSAGSIALTNSFPGCLNYMNCKLNVHMESGSSCGQVSKETYSEINLTDNQAVILSGQMAVVIE